MTACPPLRYSVPAIIFLLGSLLSIGSYIHERNLSNAQLEALVNRYVQFIGNQISGVAAYLIADEDISGLRQQVASLGADPILKYAFVCDDQFKVLISSTFEHAGQPLSRTPLAYAGSRLHSASPKASTEISSDRLEMLGIFPFLLPPSEGDLISTRKGFLLLEYDLSHPKRQVMSALFERWLIVTAVLGLLCVLAWYFFHRVVNQRISKLVAATEKLAQGEMDVSVQLAGSDELARLSRAFDLMAQKLTSHTADLRKTNTRMKQEITERQFIEEALRNSERRFRSIWENSLDAMRLSDGKGTILAVNPAFCNLVGMPMEELLERPFTVAQHPGRAEHSLKSYQEAFASRSLQPHQQKRLTLISGQTLDVEVTYSFIEMERPLLLGIFRDVSERAAALENLREAKDFSESLIKTANVMIVGLDEQHRITIFNETAEKISGFSRADVCGKKWEELVIRGTQYQSDTSNSDTSQFAKTFEGSIQAASGDERLISWQTNSIHRHGRHTGTICFGVDITDRKKQEEQRLALERKLLDSQKLESLGVLAGGIAHDFNNLLTAILGNASLAAMQLHGDSRAKNYLSNVEKTALRAAELCKQMLAYSGKGRFTMQYLDLNEVVRETVELLEVSITKKAALRIELRPELPGVAADPAQIRQVLMNLVINASEAIGDSTGVIRIRTGTVEADTAYFNKACVSADMQEGEYVYVDVTDSGCGMSEETIARIFDPFFTTKFTGRGLGLAAVLGIVRGHSGALKIQSEPGKGSSFRFLLPIAKSPAQPVVNSTTNNVIDWKGEGTILVVDDDPTVRAVTSRMVEACGFNVLQAVDGRHGVQVFRENREQIRAVLLDLTMPNLNGQEAYEQMRKLQPDVKVLLISGFSEGSKQAQFAQSGPRGFLQKPFRPQDLNAKLKTMISES